MKLAGRLSDLNGSEVFASIAFYRNYLVSGGWYTGHFWSLAVEEHFYLIIPLLLSRVSARNALIVAVVLGLASAASRAVAFQGYSAGDVGVYVTYRTENRFDGLFCGAILALILRDEKVREWMTRALSPIRVAALAVVTLVLLKVISEPAMSRTMIAWTMPLFIASTVLNPSTWAGRILDLGPVRWVGRLSYSLYLWQQFFLKVGGHPGAQRMGGQASVVAPIPRRDPGVRGGELLPR